MTLTAKLKLQLLADNVLVAESDDPMLWQRVFAAVASGQSVVALQDPAPARTIQNEPDRYGLGSDDVVAHFATQLGVDRDIVVGACGPMRVEPYITLDHHCYEAFKKNTPQRGPGSVSPAGLAATLLALWFKTAKLDIAVTVALCQAVLNTIALRDANAARGIRNAEWLQSRGSTLVLNPARISSAVRVARSYCAGTVAEG